MLFSQFHYKSSKITTLNVHKKHCIGFQQIFRHRVVFRASNWNVASLQHFVMNRWWKMCKCGEPWQQHLYFGQFYLVSVKVCWVLYQQPVSREIWVHKFTEILLVPYQETYDISLKKNGFFFTMKKNTQVYTFFTWFLIYYWWSTVSETSAIF